jgi:hypothetical protein
VSGESGEGVGGKASLGEGGLGVHGSGMPAKDGRFGRLCQSAIGRP